MKQTSRTDSADFSMLDAAADPDDVNASSASIYVGGDVSGQIAAGHNIVQMQIGQMHGNVVLPAQRLRVRRRPGPLRVLPRPPMTFVDRASETSEVRRAFTDGFSLLVSGQPGIGKSSLLRQVAHQPFLAARGAVHASVREQPRDDILQLIFDLCYEADRPYKPTLGQLRHYLQSVDCALLLDDMDLDARDVGELLDYVPASWLMITSARDLQINEVRKVYLAGLPADYAPDLVGACLRRRLSAPEQDMARRLSAAVGGVPLQIVQSAAAIRDLPVPVKPAEPVAAAAPAMWQAVADRDGPDRRLLAAVAALSGLPLAAADLQAVCDVPDASARLADLSIRGLASEQQDAAGSVIGYASPRGLAAALPAAAVTEARLQLRRHLLSWARNASAERPAAWRVAAIVELIRQAAATQQWRDVLELGQAVDRPIALSGHWETWRRTLRSQITAATAVQDDAALGYALHQLGTLSLCLSESAMAGDLLRQALQLRLRIGDSAGARVTRHNLDLLTFPTTGGDGDGPEHPVDGSLPSIGRWRRWARARREAVPTTPWLAKLTVIFAVAVAVVALGPRLIGLADSATTVDALQISPPRLVFADQTVGTASPARTVSLTNSRPEPLKIGDVQVTGRQAGDFSVNAAGCRGVTIPAAGTCMVRVTFVPTGGGRRNATLNIADSRSGHHPTIAVAGTGSTVTPPGGSVSARPTILVFGAQRIGTTGSEHEVAVTNSTAGRIRFGSATIAGADPGDFQLVPGDCQQQSLARGRGCRLRVRFTPTARGHRAGILALAVRGSRPDVVIPLNGTAIGPASTSGTGSTTTQPASGPTLQVPKPITVEATSSDGASVDYQVVGRDTTGAVLMPACQPVSGSIFPLGPTQVSCTVTDAARRSTTGTFPVTVADTRPPEVATPGDLRVEQSGTGSQDVTWPAVTAVDAVSGPAEVTCDLPSGSAFHAGTTTVTCTASDAAGNTGSGHFTITVSDTRPPALTVSRGGSFETQSPYGVTAEDVVDGKVTVTCEPNSVSASQSVTCSASDHSGNTASKAVSVTVIV